MDAWGLEVEIIFYVTSIDENSKGGLTAKDLISVNNKDTEDFLLLKI